MLGISHVNLTVKRGLKDLTTENVAILTTVLPTFIIVRLNNNVSIVMEALAARNDCLKP